MELIKKEVVTIEYTYTIEVSKTELLQLHKAMGEVSYGLSLYNSLDYIVKKEGLK